MKAAVLEELNKMAVKEVPEPEVGKGDVPVRIKACAICGSDIRTFHYGHKLVTPPRIIGHEMAGIITRVGGEVKGFKEGDRVTVATSVPCLTCNRGYFNLCDNLTGVGFNYGGGFAEYSVIPEPVLKADNLLKLPDNLSFERFGAFIEPISVALHLVRWSGFSKGKSGLVFGAGAIGILTAMWLKIFGAEKVVIADLRSESLEIASKAGIEDVVNPQDKEFKTHGDFDACFEAAGSNAALISALEKVKRKGVVTIVGRDTKDTIIPHKMFESFMRKELTIKGTWGYNNVGEEEFIYRMLKESRFNLKPLITREIPLSEGERIIRQMYNKEIFFCKVLFAI